jgi:hypothetical protein
LIASLAPYFEPYFGYTFFICVLHVRLPISFLICSLGIATLSVAFGIR